MFKQIFKYLLGGLSIVLPIVTLLFLLYFFYNKFVEYCHLESGWVLILPVLIGLIVLGYLRTYFGSKLIFKFDSYLIKTPIVGALYKSIKDVTNAFVGAENKFSEPVLVRFAGDIYKLGFITNKENDYLRNPDNKKEEMLFSVYFPLSFSLSGDLFIVPQNRIRPINKKANEVMQMIVSGGLIKGVEES